MGKARVEFLRLVLLLLGYAIGAVAGLVAIGFLLSWAGGLAIRLTAYLGGNLPAKLLGFVFGFVLLLASSCGIGAVIGLSYGWASKRWPDNPIDRLVRWVRNE